MEVVSKYVKDVRTVIVVTQLESLFSLLPKTEEVKGARLVEGCTKVTSCNRKFCRTV